MVTTFVLVPGADGRAWYWHRVIPELRARGHEAVAVDLPQGGLTEHADTIVAAIGDRPTGLGRARRQTPPSRTGRQCVVLVAQSLAGFTAPLAAARVPVDRLVLVNAMVPRPGESAGEWWDNTGQEEASRAVRGGADFDVRADFFHDVPPEVTEEAFAAGPPAGPSDLLFGQPWPLPAWPDVPTRFIQGRDDRFFPLEFQRRVVGERLGIPVEELPGGHLIALSQPKALAAALCP